MKLFMFRIESIPLHLILICNVELIYIRGKAQGLGVSLFVSTYQYFFHIYTTQHHNNTKITKTLQFMRTEDTADCISHFGLLSYYYSILSDYEFGFLQIQIQGYLSPYTSSSAFLTSCPSILSKSIITFQIFYKQRKANYSPAIHPVIIVREEKEPEIRLIIEIGDVNFKMRRQFEEYYWKQNTLSLATPERQSSSE
jgi:hypothetical protein